MGKDTEDENDGKKERIIWDGNNEGLDDFDKRIGRWCRKMYGTTIGNHIWENSLPEVEGLHGRFWNDHAEMVWDAINEQDSHLAKGLWDVSSGFWQKTWHVRWRRKQYDKLFDKVEASVKDSAALEVANLGMEKAKLLRSHLFKQFGGAGEDIQVRQERFEAGMPANAGGIPFPNGVNMINKLRELEAERVALYKLCPSDRRKDYEWGKETTLVKIVLRHLRPTVYSTCVKALVADVKLKMDVKASIPVWNDLLGEYAVPDSAGHNTEDWDYRNYHEDWLPKWSDLKSKLVSEFKEKQFQTAGSHKGNQSNHDGKPLPTMYMPGVSGFESSSAHSLMFMPGAGINPKVQCFGCGGYGHRKGDPGCPAGPDDWHDCCPPKFLQKIQQLQKSKKRKGVDGFSSQKTGDGICYAYRDTGKCKFGPKCKFKHVKGSETKTPILKRLKLTKADKKSITVAAVKSIRDRIKSKGGGEKNVDDNELRKMLTDIWHIRTIPRDRRGPVEVVVSEMATSDLLDGDKQMCYDTGAAAGVSTMRGDFVWLDESTQAKQSVNIRGPSVGKPGCEGRGPLVYRREVDGVPYGLIDPEGVYASNEMNFRVSSAQLQKARGLRIIGGKFKEPDVLECVRSNRKLDMATVDNIMCLDTKGEAREIVDSPAFRKVVDDIRLEKRSPLVNLSPYLPSRDSRENAAKMTKMNGASFLGKLLFLSTVVMTMNASCMVFNEARASPEERTRLWVRRFAYCDPARIGRMGSMPEYGDFPRLPTLNEDNVVGDAAKFKRAPFSPNDPAITMACPPWWRVYVDGYGGQKSLGGDSYEGAVGSYLFVCCSTGSVDSRLYSSHEQFPVALSQFLRRVESEHFKVQIIHCDTFSVNMSVDAEDVVALFGATIVPVSAGTPQEMSFAESMVRVVKRMSTAMLAGAPHLPPDSWACADKYSVFLHDFMPQSTRNGHCPYYLRTGRTVNWKVLPIHVFGAPLCYAPLDGPIHKRAPIADAGHFMGVQWPAVLVRRSSDKKIINCARQKVRVYEKAYLSNLDQHLESPEEPRLEDLGMGTMHAIEEADNANESSVTGESNTDSNVFRPELDKNMVQSVKSLREYRYGLPGKRERKESALERSAAIVGDDIQNGGEGLYIDEVCNQASFERLTEALDKAKDAAAEGVARPSLRQQVLTKLNSLMDLVNSGAASKGQLKVGKRKGTGNVVQDNVLTGKRKRNKDGHKNTVKSSVSNLPAPKVTSKTVDTTTLSSTRRAKPNKRLTSKKAKGKQRIKEGDIVSLPATAFDGDVPGSFSIAHPEPSYGTVKSIDDKGLVVVEWMKDDHDDDWVTEQESEVRLRDLTLEVRRKTVSTIIVHLVEGEQVAFESQDKNNWPKNFFELLVKKDWRKWVASVKKELQGWDDNNAVSVVKIEDVPVNAKVVPLGELYSIKRDGRYKFRQYLMGNLLREGVDFAETFSTTVSSSGICMFYSLATTCKQWVWGWDAVCGYLQSKEQYDVYAFLPSHHEYSSLS